MAHYNGMLSFFRTLKSFETFLRKGGRSTDYYIPPEVCVMMNTIIDCKNKVRKKNGVITFCRLLIFFKINFFEKKSGIPSKCQIVWIQIRPNIKPELYTNCLQKISAYDRSLCYDERVIFVVC